MDQPVLQPDAGDHTLPDASDDTPHTEPDGGDANKPTTSPPAGQAGSAGDRDKPDPANNKKPETTGNKPEPAKSVCTGHAGARLCDDAGALYTCTQDEKIASQIKCDTHALCQPGIQTGTCARCVPQQTRCSDSRLERCNDRGEAFDTVSVCMAPDRCDASLASCMPASAQPNKLMLSTWAKQQGSYWDGQIWMAADATGDGRADMINVYGDADKLIYVDVHAANSDVFNFEMWTVRDGEHKDVQFWSTGDFNGDGKADVAKVWDDAGSVAIDVYISTGTAFKRESWAMQAGGIWPGQVWLAGDFSGDGKSDLAVIFNGQNGVSIDVHVSDGKRFTSSPWLVKDGSYAADHKWVAGDFNGDSRVDIARVFGDGGKITSDAYISDGKAFARQSWISREGSHWDGQVWLAADFTGDGLCDLGVVYADGAPASIDVRPSTGKNFGLERWTNRLGTFTTGQTWVAGDFNGNQKADFGVVYGDNGMITIDVQSH